MAQLYDGCTAAETAQLRELVEKQRVQIQEGVQRESVLVKRLTEKEQDVQDLLVWTFLVAARPPRTLLLLLLARTI